MFIDSVEIIISSGNGGAGAVSFRREKFVIAGGPDGGDGGAGGDIIFEVSDNLDTLSKFRGKKHYKAQNGQPGGARKSTGKSGEDLIIMVPLGTQIIELQSGAVLADLQTKDARYKILEGGKGGLGNAHFKNATNQAPTYAQKGILGKTLHIRLELKLIADVGLVGYPNVGKSSLIATLSNAKPQIANYEFTTITPHLGVVQAGEFESFVMADIPGIIDGASEGKGLGLAFLKHIERTKFLLFVIDIAREIDVLTQYQNLESELCAFSALLAKRNFGIIISKTDTSSESDIQAAVKRLCGYFKLTPQQHKHIKYQSYLTPSFLDDRSLEPLDSDTTQPKTLNPSQTPKTPMFIIPISSVAHTNTKELTFILYKALH